MEKSLGRWQLAGFLFTSVLGTFLHFLFDISRQNVIAALFSAVNESIWEHMKLLYYPMVLFAVIAYFSGGKDIPGFWCKKLAGIALGLGLIPVLYYTYTGVLGVSADWYNVTIFFIAAAVAYWAEAKLFQKNTDCPLPDWAALLSVFLIGAVFAVLTFLPPHIPFFRDPLTGTYGYQNKMSPGSNVPGGLLNWKILGDLRDCRQRHWDRGQT